MRSTFSRTFYAATVVLLVTLLVVGFCLRALLSDYLDKTSYQRLDQEAQVIAELAAAYEADGSMVDMELLVDLDIAGQVSDSDAMICDREGKVILRSDRPLSFSHQGLSVDEKYLDRVIREGVVHDSGVIRGLYGDHRYVSAVPILDDQGQALGVVIVSKSVVATQDV